MTTKTSNKISLYLFLTFALTYLFWGMDIALSCAGRYEHPMYNIGIVFYIIAACSPAITVYILTRSGSAKNSVRRFFVSAFKFNAPVQEILLLCIFTAIRFGIPCLFGEVSIIGSWKQVLVFTPVMLFFGGFEEVGWRGFLQPESEKKIGFAATALINWAIWLVWHIPLCFIKGTYQYSGSYLWFAVSLLGSAFSLAALKKAKGSTVPCIIFHSFGNAVTSYGLSVDDGAGTVVSCCIQITAAVLVAALCSRKEKPVSSQ